MMKRVYQNDNIILADGKHEALIDEETFNTAKEKRYTTQDIIDYV